MLVTLEEVKNYLRVDGKEEDELISGLIVSSESICRGILGKPDISEIVDGKEHIQTAVLFGVAYLYEHRAEANHNGMLLTLRALLTPLREEKF